MKAQRKQRKSNKKIKVTEDILKQLQEAMNDTIKPDFKEKRDGKKGSKGKGKNQGRKKEQSPDGSTERSKSEAAV